MKLYNATQIAENLKMSKTKVLRLIEEGILKVSETKTVRFYGKQVSVNYVSEDDINLFSKSELYNDYVVKRELRKKNKAEALELVLEKWKIEKEVEIEKQEKWKIAREAEIEKIIESYGGITEKLLGEVAYSFSKRAKNSDSNEDRTFLYSQKDIVLEKFSAIEIHLNKRTISYIEYPEDEYVQYWERERYRVSREVVDVLEYFTIGDKTFHRPIGRLDTPREVGLYTAPKGLQIREIELNSTLVDNSDLLDLDICNYVVKKL